MDPVDPDSDSDSDSDLDPDPAIFVIDLQEAQVLRAFGIPQNDLQEAKKLIIKKFCLLLFEGTFTSFFKDKKSKRSHKTVGIKFFLLLFLLDDRRIRSGSIPQTN